MIDPPHGSTGEGPPTDTASRRFAVPGGRRTLLASAVLVMCLLVSGVAVAVSTAGTPRSPLVATVVPPTSAGPTASTAPADTTSTTEAPATTIAATPTTVPSSRPGPVAPVPTTPTTLACSNSYNPACGAFRWVPAPASSDAATVSIAYSPSDPQAGDMLTFSVHVSDPDTAVSTCGQVQYGTGVGNGCEVQYGPCPTRYGPWTPPAKSLNSADTTYSFRYSTAGSYTFSVEYPIGSPCYDPYQGTGNASVTFTVAPQSTSTSVASG